MTVIPEFFAPEHLEQFRVALGAERRWMSVRGSSWSVPDPARHGLFTGQLCQFLSQPPLLSEFGRHVGLEPSHFVGNLYRHAGGDWCAVRAPSNVVGSLVVNAHQSPVRIAFQSHGERELVKPLSPLSGIVHRGDDAILVSARDPDAWVIAGYLVRSSQQ